MFKSSQHQVPYIVCVRVCVCVCDIFFESCISPVTLYKRHGRYYVERGSIFFVFLDYIYYQQQQFLQQKYKKN